jgi:hypothetical protein
MEGLSVLGIFFAGMGVFFIDCGVLWWVSLQDKKNKAK